ncbi:MAG: hypothetical protein QW727_00345 [Candidatus Pacearchaeota archaeon]
MVKRRKKNFNNKVFSKVRFSKIKLNPPIGVKIVSIFYLISGLLSMFFGVLALLSGVLGFSLLSSQDVQNMIDNNPGLSIFGIESGTGLFTTFFILGFFVLLWGFIHLYIGKGLWRAVRIAYVAASTLVLIGILFSLTLVISLSYSGLIPLILYGALGYFLWVDKNSRAYFGLSYKLLKRR